MEDDPEKSLLNLIQNNVLFQAGNNIKEKIENYLKSDKYDSKKEIFQSLNYIIDKNSILNNESLLGFKNTICKILIKALNKKGYKEGDLDNIFIFSEDEGLRKRMKIASLLSFMTQNSKYKILFFMLNKQKFQSLKRVLAKFEANLFENYNNFNDKITKIEEKDLNELMDKDELTINDIKGLLCNTEDTLLFINGPKILNPFENATSKKIRKNKKNINNVDEVSNDEEIIQTTKESQIKLNEERKKRIFELMNESINICAEIKELNFNNFINNDLGEDILEKDLLIDDCKIIDNKIYLFSPIFLMIHDKYEFEKNDFEIFNKDNIYIEIFGKYLEEIIEKLNYFINNGKEPEYIKEKGIKFGCYKTHYYLCCKFSKEFKEKYFEKHISNENCLIKNIDSKEEIEFLNIKNNKKEETLSSKEIASQPIEKKEDNISGKSSAKISRDNYRNKIAHNFENEVKEFLCESQNYESLHNLIFFFNLKIHKKNNKRQSVVLIFNNKSVGSLYGFREIDVCFKNKLSRSITNNVLNNNLIYEIKNRKFKLKKEQPIDVSLKENSIVFCEVKNSFPYSLAVGDEKYDIIKLKNENKYDNIYKDTNNLSFTYIDKLDILLKKSKIFFDFFLVEKLITKDDIFHIIFLYDESNISDWGDEIEEIGEIINKFLDEVNYPTVLKNAILQIAYFDKEKYLINKNKEKDDMIKDLKDKRKEDAIMIQNLTDKRKEDAIMIQNLTDEVEELKGKLKNLKNSNGD